jgi:hypothetical protein
MQGAALSGKVQLPHLELLRVLWDYVLRRLESFLFDKVAD